MTTSPVPLSDHPRAQPDRAKTWFGRNWKWFVPLLIATWIILGGAFAGGLWHVIETSIRSSYPDQYAVKKATESAQVEQQIGTPIKAGLMTTGSIKVQGLDGEAIFTIPIKGSRGRRTIYVEAEKHAETWTFHRVEVLIEGESQPIELEGPQQILTPGRTANST